VKGKRLARAAPRGVVWRKP